MWCKREVRWAKVTDRKGRGMLFEMDENNGPMMFSALPYTPHEMENAMHPYELPEVHYTVVRVAKDQMGIGGDDSWGARTHEEYLLETDKKMEFPLYLKDFKRRQHGETDEIRTLPSWWRL